MRQKCCEKLCNVVKIVSTGFMVKDPFYNQELLEMLPLHRKGGITYFRYRDEKVGVGGRDVTHSLKRLSHEK